MEKYHKLPFPSHHVRFDAKFDLIYLDLWTSYVLANTGARYFLLIVDDCSYYIWIYFLNTKDEAH